MNSGRPASPRWRGLLGVGDQLLFSLSNVVVTVVVARAVSAKEFGAFALAMASYFIFTEVVRGATSETLTIRYTTVGHAEWKQASSAAVGTAGALGVVVALIIALVSLGVPETLSRTLMALAIALPGLALQDALRFAALAKGAPAHALINDGLQFVTQIGAIALVTRAGYGTPVGFVLAWGAASYFAAAVSSLALGVRPRVSMGKWWIRNNWPLASRLGLDNLVTQGSGQISSLVLAIVSGLAEVGALRAVQTAYKPTAILGLGVRVALVPELVRSATVSRARLIRDVRRLSFGLGVVAGLWATMLLAMPSAAGEWLLGDSWSGAAPLVGWFAVAQVANGVRFGPEAGLRALEAGSRTLAVRLVVSILSITALLVGTLTNGVLGLAIASAIVRPIEAAIWWAAYRAIVRR